MATGRDLKPCAPIFVDQRLRDLGARDVVGAIEIENFDRDRAGDCHEVVADALRRVVNKDARGVPVDFINFPNVADTVLLQDRVNVAGQLAAGHIIIINLAAPFMFAALAIGTGGVANGR